MWGIGIRPGFNIAWQISPSFSLFSDWAVSAVISQFDVRRKDRFIQFFEDGSTSDHIGVNMHKKLYSIKGVLEFALGLRWDIWLGRNKRLHYAIQAAWEEQLW